MTPTLDFRQGTCAHLNVIDLIFQSSIPCIYCTLDDSAPHDICPMIMFSTQAGRSVTFLFQTKKGGLGGGWIHIWFDTLFNQFMGLQKICR